MSENRPRKGFGILQGAPFVVSLVFHAALLLAISGVVLVPVILPETTFDSSGLGLTDASMNAPVVDEFNLDDMLEEPTDPTMDTAVEMDAPAQNDLEMDIITTSAANSSVSMGNLASLSAMTPPKTETKASDRIKKAINKLATTRGSVASKVNVLGSKGQGKNIIFVVDLSGSMVFEQRGGDEGFIKLKDKISDLIFKQLSPETAFNVLVYDVNVHPFKDYLVPATGENKAKLRKWFDPIMPRGPSKSKMIKYEPKISLTTEQEKAGQKGFLGSTRTDRAMAAAFEMGGDVIFLISDGEPQIPKPRNNVTDSQIERYKKELIQYKKDKAAWDAMTKDEQQKNPKKRPQRVKDPADNGKFSHEEVLDFVFNYADETYKAIGEKLPVVNSVGYSADERGEEFMQKLSKKFRGTYLSTGKKVSKDKKKKKK